MLQNDETQNSPYAATQNNHAWNFREQCPVTSKPRSALDPWPWLHALWAPNTTAGSAGLPNYFPNLCAHSPHSVSSNPKFRPFIPLFLWLWTLLYIFLKTFNYVLGGSWLKCCDSFKWTAKGLSHTYTCIHSLPNPLPSRLPHNIEQSSTCYTGDPCWLSILSTAVCTGSHKFIL